MQSAREGRPATQEAIRGALQATIWKAQAPGTAIPGGRQVILIQAMALLAVPFGTGDSAESVV